MPQYDFIAKDPENRSCELCSKSFEVMQSLSENPLNECPQCGAPVKKLLNSLNISHKKSTKNLLSDNNLKKKGFTKLVNEGGGKFRRTT